jgi:hypothetical protein
MPNGDESCFLICGYLKKSAYERHPETTSEKHLDPGSGQYAHGFDQFLRVKTHQLTPDVSQI